MLFEKRQLLKEKENKAGCYLLGVDLGRTNTTVSIFNYKNRSAEVVDLSNGFGKLSIRTALQYRDDTDEWIIGQDATTSQNVYKDNTIVSVISEFERNDRIKLGEDFYNTDEILSKYIELLIKEVEIKSPISQIYGICISVPNSFSQEKKQKVVDAVELINKQNAYITVINRNESILTNHYKDRTFADNKMLVISFGGESMEASIFETTNNDSLNVEIKLIKKIISESVSGNAIDNIIVEKFYEFIEDNGYKKEHLSEENIESLKLKAVEVKEQLSFQPISKIPFTFCVPPFIEKITYEEFENLLCDIIEEMEKILKSACAFEMDNIILVGGSSHMPWVKHRFSNSNVFISENPEFDVSKGACLYIAKKFEVFELIEFKEVYHNVNVETTISYDIGFNVNNEFYPVIKRGSSLIYCEKTNQFLVEGANELTICVFKRFDINDKIDLCKELGKVQFKNIDRYVSVFTKIIDNGERIRISINDETFYIDCK